MVLAQQAGGLISYINLMRMAEALPLPSIQPSGPLRTPEVCHMACSVCAVTHSTEGTAARITYALQL